MWNKLLRSKEPTGDLVALVDQGGVLLAGPSDAINGIVTQLTSDQAVRSFRVAMDPAAVLASASATALTNREYIRLSPDSLTLLRQHGAVPGTDGFFRMFVHDGKHIAGQLQWAKVRIAPEQALSLQVSAVSLALRAVIMEVQQSLERVEKKLDHLTRLMRAERLGEAVGDYQTLSHLVGRVRSTGRFSTADWATVAGLGPEIARDLETLRAHIRSLLDEVEPRITTWMQAEEAKGLIEEDWLEESLALLAIVEHNFALWQELRIAHVRANEPGYLAETVGDARSQIENQRDADQRLLNALSARAADVTRLGPLDGLDPFNSRRLIRVQRELDRLITAFADQRLLDATSLSTAPLPGFRKSVRHLAVSAGQATVNVASGVRNWRRRRPDTPSLPVGSDEADQPPG